MRGLSSRQRLKDLMTELNSEREDSEILKPCDVFHLIGGTTTECRRVGPKKRDLAEAWLTECAQIFRLNAIRLGQLEMGVEEGILAYTERMKSVFRDKIRNIPIDWSGKIVITIRQQEIQKGY